jgi:6-hydroxycyclohex-1-ene-1-carbonyl-CoA dehydrogenase
MSKMSVIKTWQMTEPGKLTKTEIPVPELTADDVLVEIKGCGVCHTDLSYFYQGVPTVTKPPLTLGHEISGVIVEGKADLIGKEVIVPAVMPCNNCPICAKGRGNRCLSQKMPGNSLGIYGGFSSHIPVPYKDLCYIDNRKDFPLEVLAVVADAVTTPYQAALRGDLQKGDMVMITGAAGGVGSYMTQTAKAFGAACVVGFDIADDKLENMKNFGLDLAINPKGKDIKEIKDLVKAFCKEKGLPSNFGWKIFECTGTKPGQELALDFLSFIGRLVVIGYGPQKVEYMLSKLMAFDAEIVGTWGCPPKHYANVLKLVLEDKIKIKPFVEMRPMSQIAQVFDDAHHGKLQKRVVLTPDF